MTASTHISEETVEQLWHAKDAAHKEYVGAIGTPDEEPKRRAFVEARATYERARYA